MLDEVPTADVVVTNPTHFAVALKYEQGKDAAPVVLLKVLVPSLSASRKLLLSMMCL